MLISDYELGRYKLAIGIFNIPHKDFLEIYLGSFGFQGRSSYLTFQETVNKDIAKLEGWKTNALSKARSIVLIQ